MSAEQPKNTTNKNAPNGEYPVSARKETTPGEEKKAPVGEDLADVIAARRAQRSSPPQIRATDALAKSKENSPAASPSLGTEPRKGPAPPPPTGKSPAATGGRKFDRHKAAAPNVAALAAAIGGNIPALPSKKPRGLVAPLHRGAGPVVKQDQEEEEGE